MTTIEIGDIIHIIKVEKNREIIICGKVLHIGTDDNSEAMVRYVVENCSDPSLIKIGSKHKSYLRQCRPGCPI